MSRSAISLVLAAVVAAAVQVLVSGEAFARLATPKEKQTVKDMEAASGLETDPDKVYQKFVLFLERDVEKIMDVQVALGVTRDRTNGSIGDQTKAALQRHADAIARGNKDAAGARSSADAALAAAQTRCATCAQALAAAQQQLAGRPAAASLTLGIGALAPTNFTPGPNPIAIAQRTCLGGKQTRWLSQDTFTCQEPILTVTCDAASRRYVEVAPGIFQEHCDVTVSTPQGFGLGDVTQKDVPYVPPEDPGWCGGSGWCRGAVIGGAAAVIVTGVVVGTLAATGDLVTVNR